LTRQCVLPDVAGKCASEHSCAKSCKGSACNLGDQRLPTVLRSCGGDVEFEVGKR
jgi:hypothetical protein